jgi:hypothetical protein
MHIPHLRYIGFLIYPIWGILYFAYTPFFSSKIYPVLNYYFICIYILYRKKYIPRLRYIFMNRKKNIPRLRYIFNNRKNIYPVWGIFLTIEKNIPQTGYKRKIKYTPNGVYFFCASITMMRNFWRIMVSYFLSRKITHHGCTQVKNLDNCKKASLIAI